MSKSALTEGEKTISILPAKLVEQLTVSDKLNGRLMRRSLAYELKNLSIAEGEESENLDHYKLDDFNAPPLLTLTLGKGCFPLPYRVCQRSTYSKFEVVNSEYWNRFSPDEKSRRVFIGGIPRSLFAYDLHKALECVGKNVLTYHNGNFCRKSRVYKGYILTTFKQKKSVENLLSICRQHEGRFWLHLMTKKYGQLQVEVRPWFIRNQLYVSDELLIDMRFVIFMGGLPSCVTASELKEKMSYIYQGVSAVSLETVHRLDYPKGSAKVVFCDVMTFRLALYDRWFYAAIDGKIKAMEMKPFFHPDQFCESCLTMRASFYCMHSECMLYLCKKCKNIDHMKDNTEHGRFVHGK